MPKAVIFDFDGVVVDSEKYWPEVGPKIYRTLAPGVPWGEEDQRKMKGHSIDGTHAILTKEYGVSIALPDYLKLVTECAAHIYDEAAMPMPRVTDLLDRLQHRGTSIAVASSNRKMWIDATMQRTGLAAYFPIVCTGDDVPGRSKPHPDVYLLAAHKLARSPEDCIAFEDSDTGIAAAKAAGMFCIAVRTPENRTMSLAAADLHIDDFDELTDERLTSLLG